MQRIGIVDLGSNTARLVDFSYDPGGWFRLGHQIREPIRLGEGLGVERRLTGPALGRATDALALFVDYAASTDLGKLEVLGTSAVRDAENRDELLQRLEPLGLTVRVLSGTEEARLGVLAVSNGFELRDAWVMDLGGGSAQLSLMEARRFAGGDAHPLGAVRLTERHLTDDPPRRRQIRALEEAVDAELAEPLERMAEKRLPIVGMGGSLRNLARAAQKSREYPLDLLHGYFLEQRDLEELTDTLLGLTAAKRSRIPGIKADRSDIILAAALVYRRLLQKAAADGIWISGHGVREGAFFRRFLPPPHLIPALRPFSVHNVLSHYAQAKGHIDLVRYLAARLFEQLQPLHDLGPRDSDLLDAAAQLQDIGLAVNYYRHDRHGAYLISSAPLNGFSHREQALIALLVRYHLKGTPGLGRLKGLCREGDKRTLTALTCILRLADHLDRSRAGRVRELTVEIGKRAVKVRIESGDEPATEIRGVETLTPLFEKAFERRLKLVA
ncbi:MAG: exopolyphosphatase [Thermoanaerobaculia bacterium]